MSTISLLFIALILGAPGPVLPHAACGATIGVSIALGAGPDGDDGVGAVEMPAVMAQATEAQCDSACKNVSRLAIAELTPSLEAAGNDQGAARARSMADTLTKQCLVQCLKKSSPAEAACMAAAATLKETQACD